jgi:hypothetical protein
MKAFPSTEKGQIMDDIALPNGFWKMNAYAFLILVLVCSWFAYPLVFGLSYPKQFKGIMLILLGLSLFFNLLSGVPARLVEFLLEPQWLIPLGFYLIFLLCYTLSTVINFNVESILILLSSYIKLGFACFLLLFMPWRLNIKTFNFYTRFIFLLSGMAIILFFLLSKGLVSPLGTISFPSAGGTTVLENYGLGLIYRPFTFGGYIITRLQSFADEPGSFALGLLPALFWAFFYKRKLMLLVLTLSLLLTMSVGGIFSTGFVAILFAYKKGLSSILKLFGLLVIMAVLLFSVTPSWMSKGVNAYLATKYNIEDPTGSHTRGTSMGGRLKGAIATFKILQEKPWGYGAGQAHNAAGRPVAVGWLVILIEAGLVGGLAYFLAFSWLFFLAIKIFLKENNKIKLFVCASYIASYIMSAQRAQIDASFWLLWVITSLLMLGVYDKECPNDCV